MSNVKQVTFKDYRNVGGAIFREDINPPTLVNIEFRIATEITDKITPDLTNWGQILKEFPTKDGSNVVAIDYTMNMKKSMPYIRLNGRRVAVIDENTHVFTKISKLLNDIIEKARTHKTNQSNPFKVTDEFEKTRNVLMPKSSISEEFQDIDEILDTAIMIQDEIKIEMTDLLSRGKKLTGDSEKEIVGKIAQKVKNG